MTADDAAKHEIERLTAEVNRLRELERHLRDERERVRRETAAELHGLQTALREAAGRAGRGREEGLTAHTGETAHIGRRLAQREADLATAERRVRELQAQLDVERGRLAAERSRLAADRERVQVERKRLAAERQRLLRESERLAEWERQTLLDAPPAPLPASFAEGLSRLAEPGAATRSPSGRSW